MAAESERGGNYFALGALVGVALGAAMALLFAPQPGEDTRTRLKEKGIDLQQVARRAGSETPESGVGAVSEDMAASAEEVVEPVQQKPHDEDG